MEQEKEETCKWEHVENDWEDFWKSDCNLFWELGNGRPKENNMNYCPKCGLKIEEEAE